MLLWLFKPLAFHVRGKSISAEHSDFVQAKSNYRKTKQNCAMTRYHRSARTGLPQLWRRQLKKGFDALYSETVPIVNPTIGECIPMVNCCLHELCVSFPLQLEKVIQEAIPFQQRGKLKKGHIGQLGRG